MRLNRATLIALATVAISSTAFAQAVQEAATNYEVPSYDTMSLDVHGSPLFNYNKDEGNDDASMDFNVGSWFDMQHQDPMSKHYVTNSLEIKGGMDAVPDAELGYNINNVLSGGYHMWLMGSRGVRVGADVAVGLDMDQPAVKDADMVKSIAVSAKVGAGYGRIIDARVIAIAAAMYEAVGKTASAADLAKAAEIMGQNAAGAYVAKYKDAIAATAAYYADLGAAIGTDNPFKLAEVENSPIYKFGPRNVGYHFDVDLGIVSGDHGAEGDAGMSMALVQSAGYAMLLADNMGLSLEETFHYGLDDNEGATGTSGVGAMVEHVGKSNMFINIDIDWNLDHSSQWSTSAHVDFDIIKLNNADDMDMGWGLEVRTDYAIGTQTSAYAGLHFTGGNDAHNGGESGYGFLVGFQHYIF